MMKSQLALIALLGGIAAFSGCGAMTSQPSSAPVPQPIPTTQATVGGLIRRARELTSEGRYEAALKIVDAICVLDPRNDYAVGVRPLLEDALIPRNPERRYREKFDIEADRHRETQTQPSQLGR